MLKLKLRCISDKSVKPWPVSTNILGIFFYVYPDGGVKSISSNSGAKKITQPQNRGSTLIFEIPLM